MAEIESLDTKHCDIRYSKSGEGRIYQCYQYGHDIVLTHDIYKERNVKIHYKQLTICTLNINIIKSIQKYCCLNCDTLSLFLYQCLKCILHYYLHKQHKKPKPTLCFLCYNTFSAFLFFGRYSKS